MMKNMLRIALAMTLALSLLAGCVNTEEPAENVEIESTDNTEAAETQDVAEDKELEENETETEDSAAEEATETDQTEEEIPEEAKPEVLQAVTPEDGIPAPVEGYVAPELKASPLREILSSSERLTTVEEIRLADVPFVENSTGFQGGWTDGSNYYQAFIRRDEESIELFNDSYIIKYDLESQAIVQQSESMQLNHTNDFTYNPKLDCFVVCHNRPHGRWVSFVDAKTLELVSTIQLEYNIFSIDYNPARDCYVVGVSGGQNFRILDADFKNVGASSGYSPTFSTFGYVTQGVGSDDDYMYFVLHDENVIAVYDWDGNFVTRIDLQLDGEPENVSVVDGKIYFSAWHGGKEATFYRVDELVKASEE